MRASRWLPVVLLAAGCGAAPRAPAALESMPVADLWPGFDPDSVVVGARHDPTTAAWTATYVGFLVFVDREHPGWRPDEPGVSATPFDDTEYLVLRRAEALALGRALAAGDDPCWARAAVALRRKRFVRLEPAALSYERAVERYEGLAQYVANRATARAPAGFPAGELPAARIRERARAAGEAWAALLDRHAPGWRVRVSDTSPLDELLADAIGPDETCHVTDAELDALRATAAAEVAR